ncbi:energy transducer TonB [Erythrobacter rubeus]|uniref:TonB family protein n=1 Tax=Erythrobacter rubeus TaxID=2760803 RepID=A0ABR8KVH2_9SPHN|nr:energy transducer TonB [Erythrobacter rubeus]MBD2842404.1 TonB family protein [Erythrobacter rubeus]
MSYAQTANRANPLAMIGALGVPAGVGAVLVVGLAVKAVIPEIVENPDTYDVTVIEPEIDPPVTPDEPQTEQTREVTPTYETRVETPFDFEYDPVPTKPIDSLPEIGADTFGPVEVGGPIGQATPSPALPDPIKASPRGNPGRWVTDSDYRSRWVREEMSGVASFALTIDRKGKVSDCTITKSSGHAPLDEATCKLIQRRAQFEPAKDSYGNPIAGTYRNSINWKLPN